DPGTIVMGYGVITYQQGEVSTIQYGVVHLEKYGNHHDKLQKIFEVTSRLISQYHPDEMAIEEPVYGKNPQSMLKLGRAQGAAMMAALSKEIPVVEYSPKKVKKSITGNGNATKEQVAAVLIRMLKLSPQSDGLLDATDALGLAVCHAYQQKIPNSEEKNKTWASFVKNNPHRIK
ncbi:MAG: crossover junction endodeoxyribonuclease RuvC, partial [Flammeovirgaceae bacterium]|nr:crossover junction endodeoxyribonuclease RuvC [Flammeovirgaceae bacterium]MDW8288031.1 crossover junction endodeoxyribonuclease RuvC [Flammeovirgaceae bacterium]